MMMELLRTRRDRVGTLMEMNEELGPPAPEALCEGTRQ